MSAAAPRWVWLLCGGLLATGLVLRLGSGAGCVPVRRLEQIESAVYSTLERSLASLRRDRDRLSADNALLRAQLRRRSLSVASTLRQPTGEGVRSCGSSSTTAILTGAVRWRNRHGKMVHRYASLAEHTLSICKRSRVPEAELELSRALAAVPSDASSFQLQHPDGAVAAVMELGSPSERAAWLTALAATGVGSGGVGAGGGVEARATSSASAVAFEAPALAAPAAEPPASVDRASAAAASLAVGACHKRAIAFGAHRLAHRVAPLSMAEKQSFAARCVAVSRALPPSRAADPAAADPAAADAASGLPAPLPPAFSEQSPRVPSPRQSGGRYLRVDRSFAHGLGHEVLVYNLAVRLAIATNLTLLHEPLLSSTERGDHTELRGLAPRLEAILGLGRGLPPLHGSRLVDSSGVPLPTSWLSRPCPVGAKKHARGGARWSDVLRSVAAHPRGPV